MRLRRLRTPREGARLSQLTPRTAPASMCIGCLSTSVGTSTPGQRTTSYSRRCQRINSVTFPPAGCSSTARAPYTSSLTNILCLTSASLQVQSLYIVMQGHSRCITPSASSDTGGYGTIQRRSQTYYPCPAPSGSTGSSSTVNPEIASG